MVKFEAAANLAHFLLEKTGSIFGVWQGRLTAKEQRALFGKFVGKGLLIIDGTQETLQHVIKVCFGLDYDINFSRKWVEL